VVDSLGELYCQRLRDWQISLRDLFQSSGLLFYRLQFSVFLLDGHFLYVLICQRVE